MDDEASLPEYSDRIAQDSDLIPFFLSKDRHLIRQYFFAHPDVYKRQDVSNVFDISLEAAGYAYRNYQSWIRTAARRMSAYDKAMYEHFYDTKKKKFICRRSSSFPWGEEFSLENHMVLGEDV